MKLAQKLLYSSLFLGLILLLQNFEAPESTLDVKQQKEELCTEDLEVSDSERDSAQQILDGLYDSNIRADVTTAVNDQTVGIDLALNLLRYIVPWAVFLIISIFGWIFYCCYCCCDKKCPPSQCCRRDYEHNKLSKMELYVPVGFSLIINLLLFAASIAGLAYAGGVERGMKAARCSLISLFYDIAYGNENTEVSKFPGLSGLATNIDAISKEISDFQKDLKTTFSGKTSQKIKQDKDSIIVENNNMKRGKSNAAIPVQDGGVETYLSSQNFLDYILMSSGDDTKFSTNYNGLASYYKDYLKCTPQPDAFASYYDGMIQTSEELEKQAADISGDSFDTATLDSGSSTIEGFINDINDASTTLYDNTKILEDAGAYASLALNVLFGVGLGLSIVSIASIILIVLLKIYKVRGLLHFTWCIYVILMILCFILALLLHPTSVIFAEVCYYLNSFFTDYEFFQQTKFIDQGDTKDIIGSCFFPGTSKSLFEVMDLASATDPLTDFKQQIKDFQSQFTSFDGQKKDFNDKLDNNLLAVKNCQDGSVFDLEPTARAALDSAFNKFNSFKSNSGCVELATTKCGDGKLPMKSSSDTNSATFNQKCWHPSYLASSSPSCADQSGLAETAQLKSQYSKQSTNWASALSKEQKIIDSNKATSKTFEDYMGKINTFITGADTIMQHLDELLNGVDCSFLAESFKNVLDGLCVIFIPGVSRTAILIIIIGVSMFFGSLANCCVGLRSYRISTYGFKDGENQGSKIAPKDPETQGMNQ